VERRKDLLAVRKKKGGLGKPALIDRSTFAIQAA
jgi:hypothetical protein